MTEPELIGVLIRRFNVDEGKLNRSDIGHPEFSERLFKELLDPKQAHNLLVDIFNSYIVGSKELCEAERRIILAVREWNHKPPALDHICRCFMDTELKVDRL